MIYIIAPDFARGQDVAKGLLALGFSTAAPYRLLLDPNYSHGVEVTRLDLVVIHTEAAPEHVARVGEALVESLTMRHAMTAAAASRLLDSRTIEHHA